MDLMFDTTVEWAEVFRFEDREKYRPGIHCDHLRERVAALADAESLDPNERAELHGANSTLSHRLLLWKAIAREAGLRYREAGIRNFEATNGKQVDALDRVKAYLNDCLVGLPRNLVFIGPTGTGKDHLMMAVIRTLVMRDGIPACWTDGQQLFASVRDAYAHDESV